VITQLSAPPPPSDAHNGEGGLAPLVSSLSLQSRRGIISQSWVALIKSHNAAVVVEDHLGSIGTLIGSIGVHPVIYLHRFREARAASPVRPLMASDFRSDIRRGSCVPHIFFIRTATNDCLEKGLKGSKLQTCYG